jgi:hypothetical protein
MLGCYIDRIVERESVNSTQIIIKRKITEIRVWKKHLFLDISSTKIDTLVSLLYQRVETRGIEAF